jgi:hypothetical protein
MLPRRPSRHPLDHEHFHFIHPCGATYTYKTGLKGGQLIDKVHSFTSHGDPYIRTFAHKLLLQITKPWYEMLKTWIYQGVLQDPFQEFFVRESIHPEQRSKYNPSYPSASPGVSKQSAWEGKYSLEERLVPGFIGEQVARKVFLIGKSLNFIRGDCGEEGYVIEHAKEASLEGTSFLLVPGVPGVPGVRCLPCILLVSIVSLVFYRNVMPRSFTLFTTSFGRETDCRTELWEYSGSRTEH